jgi:hypothetical protein
MAEPTNTSHIGGADVASAAAPPKDRRDPKLIEREEMLARLDAKRDAARERDSEEYLASADVDPRAAALAVQMAKEARGEKIAADLPTGEEEIDPSADPTPVETFEPAKPRADAAERVAREAVRVSNKGGDPLGDYVVQVQGKPMFKTLVDGQEKLIPLEAARAQLQKHLAADIRLQQVAEQRKQLEAREAALRNNEETFKRRQHPSVQPTPAFDDRKLANELVRSLVTETEDKAAEKMAQTFREIRQASTPQIDVNALVAQARDEAVKTIVERDTQKALKSGFDQFTSDYPEIAGDSDLFNLADRKSEVIAAEHPEWTPGQVMNEAGKQTRAWLETLGARTGAAPKPTTSNQARKQNLVPMPQARTVRPAAPSDAEKEQSPADIVAEIRRSRGMG